MTDYTQMWGQGQNVGPPVLNLTGLGGTGSSFTPQPIGQTWGDKGLVFGLGPTSRFSVGTGSLDQVNRSSQNPFFSVGPAGMEIERAANWIWGPQASAEETSRYDGYLKKFFPEGVPSYEAYQGLWAQAAQDAAQVNRNDPNSRWTVWDALENMWRSFSSGGGAGSGSGTRVSTDVNTRYKQTTAKDANAVLDEALTNLLGRTATDDERAKFLRTLNAQERAAASTTTSRTVSGPNSSTGTSTSVERGVNPGSVAIDWATNQEGFAEYQYATTYLDAMLDALSSPVR